jgi:hypothetical protein
VNASTTAFRTHLAQSGVGGSPASTSRFSSATVTVSAGSMTVPLWPAPTTFSSMQAAEAQSSFPMNAEPVHIAPVPARLHGCKHYSRRCKLRASCCDKVRYRTRMFEQVLEPPLHLKDGLPQVFWCRLCHDEEYAQLKDAHVLDRRDVRFMVCLACDLEQEVAQHCEACGVRMGEYFCAECRLWDDDVSKGQFHCIGCGLCRKGVPSPASLT